MRAYIIMVATAVLLSTIAPVSAGMKRADELLAECEQLERTWTMYPAQGRNVYILGEAAAQCWGYVQAYMHISNSNGAAAKLLIEACPPENVSLVQTVKMFLQRARSSPAQLHTAASWMLWAMFKENFPCPH
jgi:Rap1a immunity proteins